nr:MAG TPA: hypothetical protein [Caudoviricetes sp.]
MRGNESPRCASEPNLDNKKPRPFPIRVVSKLILRSLCAKTATYNIYYNFTCK